MLDEQDIRQCRRNLLAAEERVRDLQAELKDAKAEAKAALLMFLRATADAEPLLKGVGMMESGGGA